MGDETAGADARPDREDAASRAAEDATRPGVWRRLFLNKFKLMERHLDVLDHPASKKEAAAMRTRLAGTLKHAQRVLAVRLGITVLLVLAAGSTAVTAALGLLEAVPAAVDLVQRIAAYAAASTFVLIGARLLCDRYLDIVQTIAFMLAIEVASSRAAHY